MNTPVLVCAAVAALAMSTMATAVFGEGARAEGPLDGANSTITIPDSGSTTTSTTTTSTTSTTSAPRPDERLGTSTSESTTTTTEPVRDVVPANREATDSARRVLRYLATQVGGTTGRRVSGQHIGNASNYSLSGLQRIREVTGEWLGLIGADIGAGGDPTKIVPALTTYWRNGGLTALSWHPKNPATGGPYNDMSIDVGKLLKPGTEVYLQWRRQLDSYATALHQLEQNGVGVILRPLHEMNCASFWWTYRNATITPDRFRALWRQTYEYLTFTKGLDNLLWAFTPHIDNMDKQPAATWYPGDGYVDIVGMDMYKGVYWDSYRTKMIALRDVAPEKPFVLGETGPDRSIEPPWDLTILRDGLRDRFPFVSYFMSWNGPWYGMENHANLSRLIDDPGTVNRGEISL